MMRHELCHIWGPFSIHSYGLAMAIGLIAFTWLCLRNPLRKAIISREKFIETVCLALIVGIIGARLLFIINSWNRFESIGELFQVWSGGLSVLGGLIAILLVIPIFLYKKKIPVLPLLDIAALNAPIMHAIARLGCFMAGCCFGRPSSLPWAITYTDLQSEAPLHVPLHPTQLYLALGLFIAFIVFNFVVWPRLKYQGQMLMIYLITESIFRFIIDFFRADIEYFTFDNFHFLSAHQWIALLMFIASSIGYIIVTRNQVPQIHQTKHHA